MESLLVSTGVVALAEIGDKTQGRAAGSVVHAQRTDSRFPGKVGLSP